MSLYPKSQNKHLSWVGRRALFPARKATCEDVCVTKTPRRHGVKGERTGGAQQEAGSCAAGHPGKARHTDQRDAGCRAAGDQVVSKARVSLQRNTQNLLSSNQHKPGASRGQLPPPPHRPQVTTQQAWDSDRAALPTPSPEGLFPVRCAPPSRGPSPCPRHPDGTHALSVVTGQTHAAWRSRVTSLSSETA